MAQSAEKAQAAAGRLSYRLLVLLVLCASWTWADVGLARHQKVYAVPVPGEVVIDGNLGDWDLSGHILQYVTSETSQMQSARFALMYDRDALYLSAVVRDPSPMMNRHDPSVDPDRAWDADVCQLFLTLDPDLGYPLDKSAFRSDVVDQACTLILWYYTDRQEPNLVGLKAMTFSQPLRPDYPASGVIPRDRFQAAYAMAPDQGGYTFEYRIPWASLGARHPPVAGDLLAATVCFFWGTPDGLKTAGGAAWCYDVMSGPGFPYQSSTCWGRILFAPTGALARELVEEGLPPERSLPLTFDYTLPKDSEATITLFDDSGRARRTLVASGARRAGRNLERWDGLGDDGRPLAAGTYTWRGLYHQPITTRFVLSAHNSGQPPYKTDDNTGGWGGDHGLPTTVCAAGQAMLLGWDMSESGWGIIKTDLAGKKQWGLRHNAEDIASDGTRFFVVGDHGYNGAESVKPFDLRDGRLLNWGNGQPVLAPPPGGTAETDTATGVTYAQGTVYVSWGRRQLVAAYDAVSGNLQRTWVLPTSPARLVARSDNSLLVIAGSGLYQVRGELVSPLPDAHLDAPRGVTLTPDGGWLVANRGRLQSIAVFDREGRYRGSIGRPGGRPRVGRYDPSGVLEPGGIAVSVDGKLWVAEVGDAPKRHSVWSLATGTLVAEFFGGSAYFGWASMDPRRPDELYCHNVLWKIDLDTGSCTPYSTIWRATAANMVNAPNPGGMGGHFRVLTARNGRQYGWGMIDYANMLYRRDGDVFKPFAGTIRVDFGPYGAGLLYPAMQAIYQRTGAAAFLWQDANDDQTVQESELTVSPADRGEVTFNWIDQDLNVWCDAGWIYPPVRFERDGRPVYDWSHRLEIPFRGTNANATSLTFDDADSAVYTLSPGDSPGWARWTRDGRLVWGYDGVVIWNDALGLPMVTPGHLHGLTMPLGTAGDYTGAASYFGPYHLFTKDGLYVAMIMRDGRSGGLGPDITASEVVTGQLVQPAGTDRYFLLAGDQDGRVTEILGLDTVERLPGGTYVHTPEMVQQATDSLAAYQRAQARGQRLDIVRGRGALVSARGVGRMPDPQRGFQARVAYDQDSLYVAYQVTSPTELVNGITDPRILFKGGNAIDIQLATDPSAEAGRRSPARGDLRLLVTRQDSRTLAVLFRPKVGGFTGDPIVLSSPTGRESFDAIEATDRVSLAYTPGAGGFAALVAIPLDLLGWAPRPGQSVSLDLGYLFGNATGTQVARRSYWHNDAPSANIIYDLPSESRLEPADWGTAAVE